MKKTLDWLRGVVRSGLDRARAGFDRARPVAIGVWKTGQARARKGWANLKDYLAKKPWMAGIEPLPPGMASGIAAITMVTGLVLTSLVYGDYYQHRRMEDRMIVSGEHPSQQDKPPPEAKQELRGPVPDTDTVESTPEAPRPLLPQTGTPFVERFDRENITDRWFVSDGWSNGNWMANDWRKGAVVTESGLMALKLQRGPKGSAYELMGGEVRTHDFRRYGYFEVKMRVPKGSGTVSGVFTYADRTKNVKPNEIDIEILGKNTRAVELTIHENGRSTSRIVSLPFDAAEGFHTYGFDWQPGYVRWYIDGVLAHEETGRAARNLVRPQQLILNLWGSRELKAWVGSLNPKQGPWKLDFSCVAYAPTYTAPLCN